MSRPSSSAYHPSRRVRRGWHVRRRASLAQPLVAALLLAACEPRAGQSWLARASSDASRPGAGIPAAEFLVAGNDSSIWVRTGPDAGPTGMQVRRAPLVLALVGGRWHELYVIEEDHSFPDAVFVAQALWRRDLVSQDSAVVMGDSVVPALAAEYARANPDEYPLEPDEPENDEPSVIAVAELSLLGVQGGYASVEHYSDIHLPRTGERHELRRATVDIGSGRELRLASLIGEEAAADVTSRGRAALVVARDSARRVAQQFDAVAAAAIDRFAFDARSFALTQVAGQPGVVFYAVGRGDAADGFALPLEPLAVTGGAWWDTARVGLPLVDSRAADSRDGDAATPRRWRRGSLTVVARPDDHPVAPRSDRGSPPSSGGGSAGAPSPHRLALRDSTGREWPLGSIGSPAQRLYWLDGGGASATERRALARAFYEAAFYDGTLRAASGSGDVGAPRLHLASARPPSRLQYRSASTTSVGRLRQAPIVERHAPRRLALRSGPSAPSR